MWMTPPWLVVVFCALGSAVLTLVPRSAERRLRSTFSGAKL
jgi:hypothetical protein